MSDESSAAPSPSLDDGRTGVHVHAGACTLARPADLAEVRRHTIADSYARFRRMRGDAVLFSLGFQAEVAANGAGALSEPAPAEDGDKAREQRQGELQRLGLSFDWSRSLTDADPAADRLSQQLFAELLDAGLAHRGEQQLDWCGSCRTLLPGTGDQAGQCRRCDGSLERMPEGQWYMKLDRQIEESGSPEAPAGDSDAAMEARDRLLGRVEGVEFEVQAFDGTSLTVFTPFPEAIGEAKFVALSPDHSELERWMQEPEPKQRLSKLRAGDSDARGQGLEYPTLMESGMWVQIPGADDLLPLIVSLAVDARFGATAILGIPSADPTDARLAEHLPPPPSLRVRSKDKQPKPRSASRFRGRLLPVSSSQRRGAVIPMLVAIPPGDRMEAGFEHPELRRWFAITTTLHDAGDATAMLRGRALTNGLRDLGAVDSGANGQGPGDFLTGRIATEALDAGGSTGDAAAPHVLAEQVGADAVRFALLYAAAPSKDLSSSEFGHILSLSENFLAHLRSYAEPRLGAEGSSDAAIDDTSRLRRRLTAWCDVALRKVTENYAELKMHRATRNSMLLLERIEDFERRAGAEADDLPAEDVAAVRSALLLLVALLAPIAPHLSDELWKLAGGAGSVGDAVWPARTRRDGAEEAPAPVAEER